MYCVELYSKGQKVLSLFSDEDMTYLLEFLLTQTLGAPISQILKGVAVPELENLKSIIESYRSLANSLGTISQKSIDLYNRLLNSAIIQGK